MTTTYAAYLSYPGLICNEEVTAKSLIGAKRKASELWKHERPEYEIVIWELCERERLPIARRKISEKTWRNWC